MVWRPVQGVHHLHPTVAWIDSRNPVTPKTDSLGLKIDWCWSKAPKYVVLYNTFPHPTDDLTYRAVEKWRGVNPKPFILNNFHSKDLVETAPHLRWPSDMLTSYFKPVYMMKLAEKRHNWKPNTIFCQSREMCICWVTKKKEMNRLQHLLFQPLVTFPRFFFYDCAMSEGIREGGKKTKDEMFSLLLILCWSPIREKIITVLLNKSHWRVCPLEGRKSLSMCFIKKNPHMDAAVWIYLYLKAQIGWL